MLCTIESLIAKVQNKAEPRKGAGFCFVRGIND